MIIATTSQTGIKIRNGYSANAWQLTRRPTNQINKKIYAETFKQRYTSINQPDDKTRQDMTSLLTAHFANCCQLGSNYARKQDCRSRSYPQLRHASPAQKHCQTRQLTHNETFKKSEN